MDLKEFRIAHSTVMEQYQFIERELEGIYAALSGKHFYFGLKDVETFSISKVIRLIQEQEKINHISVISVREEIFGRTTAIRKWFLTEKQVVQKKKKI